MLRPSMRFLGNGIHPFRGIPFRPALLLEPVVDDRALGLFAQRS